MSFYAILRAIVIDGLWVEIALRLRRYGHHIGMLLHLLQSIGVVRGLSTDVEVGHLPVHGGPICEVLAGGIAKYIGWATSIHGRPIGLVVYDRHRRSYLLLVHHLGSACFDLKFQIYFQ